MIHNILSLINSYDNQLLIQGTIVITLIVIVIFYNNYDKYKNKTGHKLPPPCPFSFFEIRKVFLNDKGLEKVSFFHSITNMFLNKSLEHPGKTKYGFIIRMPTVYAKYNFIITDYELAKIILQGNHEMNIVEKEKSNMYETLNFLDSKSFNLVTHKTTNKDREHARKAYAVNFSYSNLQRQWIYIEAALIEEFQLLHKLIHSDKNGILNLKVEMLQFFLKLLGKSAFDINVNFDHIDNENTIDGMKYLEYQEEICRERIKEVNIPFRKYMFWNSHVKKANDAKEYLIHTCNKILYHHQQSKVTNEGRKFTPLIDYIDQENYPNHMAKISDIAILLFAGHDTTSFTFSFLLMEIARNPDVKMKVQAEIDKIMPKHALGTTRAPKNDKNVNDCSNINAHNDDDVDVQNNYDHGDVKLLSAINGLEFLNYCIKESMRLWPVAAVGASRSLNEDMNITDDMYLPKGSNIVTNFYSMFRSHWIDQPNLFLPDRWSSSNPQLPQLKEMFIPFSIGKRSCLGMNMAMFQLRVVAVYFLYHYDIELVSEPTFELFITFKPDQLMMKLTERKH